MQWSLLHALDYLLFTGKILFHFISIFSFLGFILIPAFTFFSGLNFYFSLLFLIFWNCIFFIILFSAHPCHFNMQTIFNKAICIHTPNWLKHLIIIDFEVQMRNCFVLPLVLTDHYKRHTHVFISFNFFHSISLLRPPICIIFFLLPEHSPFQLLF